MKSFAKISALVLLVGLCNSKLLAQSIKEYYSAPFYKNWVLSDKSAPLEIVVEKDTFVLEKRSQNIIISKQGKAIYQIKNRILTNERSETLIAYRKRKIQQGANEYQLLINGKSFEVVNSTSEELLLSIQMQKDKHKSVMVITSTKNADVELMLFAAYLKYDLDIKSNDYWLYGLVGFWV